MPTEKCLILDCSGQTPLRVKGYCEQHYLQQFVEPLQKERRNLEEAISNLYNQELAALVPLGEARKANRVNATIGRVYKCGRGCGFQSNSSLALVWHEPDCDYKGPTLKTERSGRAKAGKPTKPKVQIDDEEAIFG
jgi:hypothetical protein